VSAIRLLMIEDSARDRQLFECLLEDVQRSTELDVECELVSSGPRGLERLSRRDYDLVVVDQNMPEMSGSEVLTVLREWSGRLRRRPKILAYSTCDLPEFRRQCLTDGADAFAPKYLTAGDFVRVLEELGLDARARERRA
jgi:CheY-like chemotaxis protein